MKKSKIIITSGNTTYAYDSWYAAGDGLIFDFGGCRTYTGVWMGYHFSQIIAAYARAHMDAKGLVQEMVKALSLNVEITEKEFEEVGA